jgi:hypothetical protein
MKTNILVQYSGGDYGQSDFDLGWDRGCRDIALRLADYFATQNPRFDYERFMKACGLE